MKRRVLLSTAAVVAAVAVFIGGWSLAKAFESPAQRAAHAAAPPPLPVDAQVTKGSLVQDMSFKVVFRFQKTRQLAANIDSDPAVVTKRTLSPGDTVGAGSVISEVNGRPIFVLPGKFAFYRDLAKGDAGPDVRQLQTGLRAAGFASPVTGTLGKATLSAVQRMYRAAGYALSSTENNANGGGDSGANSSSGSTGDTSPSSMSGKSPKLADVSNLVVPAHELIVVHSLPVTLTDVPRVGKELKGRLSLGYGRGAIIAHASVSPDDVGELSEQQRARISAGASSWQGKITHIGKLSGDKRVPVTLQGTSSNWPGHLGGIRQAVAVVTTHIGPRNALLVPTIAVVTSASGESYVLKRASGRYIRLPVNELGSLLGKTAIVPDSGTLAVGDLVRVD